MWKSAELQTSAYKKKKKEVEKNNSISAISGMSCWARDGARGISAASSMSQLLYIGLVLCSPLSTLHTYPHAYRNYNNNTRRKQTQGVRSQFAITLVECVNRIRTRVRMCVYFFKECHDQRTISNLFSIYMCAHVCVCVCLFLFTVS